MLRDKAANRGKLEKRNGRVESWMYIKYGKEPNVYRFVESPFDRHNEYCKMTKMKMGHHAVQFYFNRGLFEYRDKPVGSAYEAFMRVYNSVPLTINTDVCLLFVNTTFLIQFPTTVGHDFDWEYNMPTWFSDSTLWHEAFASKFPAFDWKNPDPVYALTKKGQVKGGQMEGERFIYRIREKPKFLFFCSLSAAKFAYECETLVCDGTFK